MTEFGAVYYDGRSSARTAVRVRRYALAIQIVAEGLRLDVPLAKIRVEPPVGGTRRIMHLPDGAQLQTDDHAAVEALFPSTRAFEGWIHLIERRWAYALAGAALVAAFAWWFVVDGLPRSAKFASAYVPAAAEVELGKQTLTLIDGKLCHPSKLSAARQEDLQALLAKLTAGLGDGYAYRLLSRDCGTVGANAFALPGGTIFITDALATLARNDDQIAAVLAHEVGHVRNRHGLRLALQAAGLAALAAAIFGDATSITGLATTLPVAVLQNGYSRDLETEADDYAFARLKEVGVSPKAFADILLLMEKNRTKSPRLESRDYLSTHPATQKRIQRALAAR